MQNTQRSGCPINLSLEVFGDRWSLLILRDMISREHTGEALSAETEAARQRVINVVNSFFRERMMALPEIERYIADMSQTHS